ncbi:hypothetical protein LTR08_003204 [Meristemomyces frigidus]|nr:hypothetical protein LTR08_003204 [Meristemomyces frigidus]
MSPSDYEYEYFNVTFPAQYVAQVEINRPAKLNAFIEKMWINLGAIFRRLSHDPDVRVVVLTAAGDRAFTAGLDVQAASQSGVPATASQDLDTARKATAIRRHIQEFQDDISAIEQCEKPVIGVLHGISFGLAIDMTTCCDIRLCAKDTRFSVREVEIGLAADIGTLSRLPHANVPMAWVKEVCLTARDFYAEEALRVGFVSGVYESKAAAMERAHELATLLASKSPVAVQGTKEVLNFSRDHTIVDDQATMESERMMLVYEHKTKGRKLVPGGVSIMSEEDIVMVISAHPDIVVINLPIKAGQTHIDLFKADLIADTQSTEAAKKANTTTTTTTNEICEEVPWRVFLGYEWVGHSFEELVILTPDPARSAAEAIAETN